MNVIKLTDLIKIEKPEQYKLHLACTTPDGDSPLKEYIADRVNWLNWNKSHGNKNDWSRDFIFSFIEFRPIKDAWLFGGVFRVKNQPGKGEDYEIEDVTEFQKYEGRLICQSSSIQGRRGRGRAFYFEKHINFLEVLQILPAQYDGEIFPGCAKINHGFDELEPIIRREKRDWKAALLDVKGVYLVLDKRNGKYYVGSAYGGYGIWSRLCCYIITGHGWNDGLVEIIKAEGIKYALTNFQFSLLETFTFVTPDKYVTDREQHWKEVLMSGKFGHYNKN